MTARLSATEQRKIIKEAWWLLMLQGVIAVLFGIIATFWPALTLVTLVYLVGAYILAWGLIEMVRGLVSIGGGGTWWLTVFLGALGLTVGVYLVRHPQVTFATFILLLGITLIFRGVFDFLAALLGDGLSGGQRTLMFIVALAAVIAGVAVLLAPASGGVAFVWIIGLYALVYGTLIIVAAIETRKELTALVED